MSDLWLPPGVTQNGNGRDGSIARPFAKLGKQIKAMGFDCSLHHDPKERVMRVRFTPNTAKTRKAVLAAGGDGQGLEVSATYGAGDKPGDVALACIDKGLETLKEVLA